ncbi:MAG: tripartite tricarboxylate transporter substrate binding protein [Burkholderiaceae bacterium]
MVSKVQFKLILVLAGAVTWLGLVGFSAAAEPGVYPVKSVKIVVPFPPGGSNDIIARLVGRKLAELTGQAFVVENRAGAAGNVGADAVARSEPDGYTLLLTAPPPLTTNAALYDKMLFDPGKAFAPVALIATVPIVLVVHPSSGITNVKELIAVAKAKPGTLNFGSSGNGSTNHLAGMLLKRRAEIDVIHVPYKGAAPALSDLIAGHIPMMFDNIPALLPQIHSKSINAIAVAGATRAKALPHVPTVAESGLPDFEASAWFGLVAPGQTPPLILAKLQAALDVILKTTDIKSRFDELGAEPSTVAGADFRRFLAEETNKWSKIIKESGAKAD